MDTFHAVIALNLSKFLDTNLPTLLISKNSKFIAKVQNYHHHEAPKLQNAMKQNTINGDLHRLQTISSKFDEEIPLIKEKFMKTDYPLRFINSVMIKFQRGKKIMEIKVL